MHPDRPRRSAEQNGRQTAAERPVAWRRRYGAPVWGDGPTPVSLAVGEESIGVDWSLLALLLSMEKRAPILALGSDLEALSLALSEAGATIVTLDHEYERIRLVQRQRTRNELTNVLSVCGDTTGFLPFRDGSVGVAIVNSTRRQLGGLDDGDPVEVETGFPLEARRILKAGGSCAWSSTGGVTA